MEALLTVTRMVSELTANVSSLFTILHEHVLSDDDSPDLEDDSEAPLVRDPAWDGCVAELGSILLSEGLVLAVVRATVNGPYQTTWSRDVVRS
jgi:hypothetical protein